jgi:iron-sulfur cluster repair protein YtfE (RIC family)
MGKASAKVKGTASKVGAALGGKVGVLNTLEGEHTEVASLMDDVVDENDADDRMETYRVIRQKLLIHAQGEEQGLYMECRAHESTRAFVDKAIQDHTRMKELIAKLDELAGQPGSAATAPAKSTEWIRTFEQLQTTVQSHVDFEENQLFPLVKDALGADALRDLDGRYSALRKQLEAHGETLQPRVSRTA